jgi:hypothetical protein
VVRYALTVAGHAGALGASIRVPFLASNGLATTGDKWQGTRHKDPVHRPDVRVPQAEASRRCAVLSDATDPEKYGISQLAVGSMILGRRDSEAVHDDRVGLRTIAEIPICLGPCGRPHQRSTSQFDGDGANPFRSLV